MSLTTDQTLPRIGFMDFTLGCRHIAFLVVLFAQLCNGQLAGAENGGINYIFMVRPKSNDLHFMRAGIKSIWHDRDRLPRLLAADRHNLL